MQIAYLADHPEFFRTLASWHHQEWAHLRPGDTLEARMTRLQAECGHAEIPTTLVAFEGQTLLGSAMLVLQDMDDRRDLSPWLAGVYVGSEHRGRGIATALVQRVVDLARELGVNPLYLYTGSAEGLYAGLGWQPIERREYHGIKAVIMRRELAAPKNC